MSTAEHTTEDNHFFLSSPPPPSILPIMLAHFHPLAVSAGDLSGRVQTASRRRNAFAFACFTSLLRKFASCSSNNWGIIIKNTPEKKKSDKNVQNFLKFILHLLKTRACRFSQKFNCKLVSQKADDDRCRTGVCFPCQQLIFTNSTTEKCGFLSVPGNVTPHPISQNTLRSLSLIVLSKGPPFPGIVKEAKVIRRVARGCGNQSFLKRE